MLHFGKGLHFGGKNPKKVLHFGKWYTLGEKSEKSVTLWESGTLWGKNPKKLHTLGKGYTLGLCTVYELNRVILVNN